MPIIFSGFIPVGASFHTRPLSIDRSGVVTEFAVGVAPVLIFISVLGCPIRRPIASVSTGMPGVMLMVVGATLLLGTTATGATGTRAGAAALVATRFAG